MNQPKYVSILKMSIIHTIAAFLSTQLIESFWMIEHLDDIHSAQNTFLPYNKFPFDTIYSNAGYATNRDLYYRREMLNFFITNKLSIIIFQ